MAVLDLFSEEQLGPTYMPSEVYPSDHIAIAADLQVRPCLLVAPYLAHYLISYLMTAADLQLLW